MAQSESYFTSNKAGGVGVEATGGWSNAKSDLIQEGCNIASEFSDKAKNISAQATHATDSVLSSVGEGLKSIAGTIRHIPSSHGIIGSATDSIAEGLQSGGEYLSQYKVEDIGKKATTCMRKYPIASLVIGVGVGILLGSTLLRKQRA